MTCINVCVRPNDYDFKPGDFGTVLAQLWKTCTRAHMGRMKFGHTDIVLTRSPLSIIYRVIRNKPEDTVSTDVIAKKSLQVV